MSRTKRVQIVEIDGREITDFFSGDLAVIEGLPDDIELVRTWEEPAKQCYCFMFKSDEFPAVAEGDEPPRTEITVARRRVNTSTHFVCHNCSNVVENGDVRCDC